MPIRSTIVPAAFSVALLIASGCAEYSLSSLSTTTDQFVQNAAAAIDVLWVVDNSESMAEEQAGLGASFAAFINNLAETQVDYHIGVVSTDRDEGGLLHTGNSGIAFIDSGTPNVQEVFLENVTVGTSGSRIERAFETAASALGVGIGWSPGVPPSPPNPNFLREDAALFVIMVSDEDDKSFGPVTYYRRLFEGYKGPGNEGRISVSAIVGPPGAEEGCAGDRGVAAPGDRYVDLAGQTGGIWTSICADFVDSLRSLSITATGLKSIFELSASPNAEALISNCGGEAATGFCVRVDDNVVPGGNGQTWVYDRAIGPNGAIVFAVSALPPPQASVTVEYMEGF